MAKLNILTDMSNQRLTQFGLVLVDDLNGSHLPATSCAQHETNLHKFSCSPGALVFGFHYFSIGAFAQGLTSNFNPSHCEKREQVKCCRVLLAQKESHSLGFSKSAIPNTPGMSW